MTTREELQAQAAAQADVHAVALSQFTDSWTALGITGGAILSGEAVSGVQDLFADIIDAWGTVSGTLGADFYEQLRADAGVPGVYTAKLPDPLNRAQTDGVIDWALSPWRQSKLISTGELDGSGEEIMRRVLPDENEIDLDKMRASIDGAMQRILRETQRAAIEESAAQDPIGRVRVARVPMGAETCAFCLVLASRGYVYRSERSAGLDNEYHDFCDCEQDVSFSEDHTAPEGYDPGDLFGKYEAAADSLGIKPGERAANVKKILAALRVREGIR